MVEGMVVEEVVTFAENCDCPVKLRVLYSLYFLLRAVSSSLSLSPSSPSDFPLPFLPRPPFFILVACWNLRAPPRLITMLGLHTSRGGDTHRERVTWAGCEEKRKPVRAIHTHRGHDTPLIQSEFTSIKLPPAPILITVRSN